MTKDQIKRMMSRLGRVGGSVKGPQKKRSAEHYRRMVDIRLKKKAEREGIVQIA